MICQFCESSKKVNYQAKAYINKAIHSNIKTTLKVGLGFHMQHKIGVKYFSQYLNLSISYGKICSIEDNPPNVAI